MGASVFARVGTAVSAGDGVAVAVSGQVADGVNVTRYGVGVELNPQAPITNANAINAKRNA